jgi:hypothetical protein
MEPDTRPWPDERPTTPAEHVPSTTLVTLMQIDQLAARAIERLEASPPDAYARLAALADLAQVRALARTVLR